MSDNPPVTIEDVQRARERISKHIRLTPVMTSSTADKITGRNVYFKAENLQKTGAFKARGALNAVLNLKVRSPNAKGVTTHSSGNHGLGLAWAAQMDGIPCTVVVPENTPECKKMAIKGYGAELVLCPSTALDRIETCHRVAEERGYEYISSSDHLDVVAGQGTVGLELLEQISNLDAILVPASGGGLTSGIAVAAKTLKPSIKVFVVEPKGKNLEECLRSGEKKWPSPPQFVDTIAEGIRIQPLGDIPFAILCKLAEKEVITVTNEDILKAQRFAFHRLKLVIETASAAALAGVLSDQMKKQDASLKNVAVILTGGNVDIDNLLWYRDEYKA